MIILRKPLNKVMLFSNKRLRILQKKEQIHSNISFIYSTTWWVLFMIKSIFTVTWEERQKPARTKSEKMIHAKRGWVIFSRGGCSVRFRYDFFLRRFFFFCLSEGPLAFWGLNEQKDGWQKKRNRAADENVTTSEALLTSVPNRRRVSLEQRLYLWSSKEDGTHAHATAKRW